MIDSKWVHFRADPGKISVAIRKNGDLWMVSILNRQTHKKVTVNLSDPKEALDRALRLAKNAFFDGIDLGLLGRYKHPWKTIYDK